MEEREGNGPIHKVLCEKQRSLGRKSRKGRGEEINKIQENKQRGAPFWVEGRRVPGIVSACGWQTWVPGNAGQRSQIPAA